MAPDFSHDDNANNFGRTVNLRVGTLKYVPTLSGLLVPQDPNDEPASELLTKIFADRLGRQTELDT